jgi:hypothetical protein
MNRMVRQICDWWKKRIFDRRLARGLPDVAARKKQIQLRRRQHKPTKPIIAENYQDIHAALRGEK